MQKKRHRHWWEACERRAEGEAEIIEAIEVLREACNERKLLIELAENGSESDSDGIDDTVAVWACRSFGPPQEMVLDGRT